MKRVPYQWPLSQPQSHHASAFCDLRQTLRVQMLALSLELGAEYWKHTTSL